MSKLRDDLALAAYAVSLGYTLRGHNDLDLTPTPNFFGDDGVAHYSLQFRLGDMHVWATERGWRCSRLLARGMFEKPTDLCFWKSLKDALDEGVRNWRDR